LWVLKEVRYLSRKKGRKRKGKKIKNGKGQKKKRKTSSLE